MDAGYFWQPPQLPASRQSRKGGREGRKEASTVAAQTTLVKPQELGAAVHGGKSQQRAGHLHPTATRPPALQRASLGNRGVKRESFPYPALGRRQGTQVMLCADSKGLTLLRSSTGTTGQSPAPGISTSAPCKALLQRLSLHQSSSLSWDAEGMGSIPAITLVVCSHTTLAPAQNQRCLRCRWGKATPEPLQTSCFHAKPRCNTHTCRGQTLSGGTAHPPLQLLQGDRDPQAVSQEEEGSQDVSPLHHLAQRAPLQHPRTENIP